MTRESRVVGRLVAEIEIPAMGYAPARSLLAVQHDTRQYRLAICISVRREFDATKIEMPLSRTPFLHHQPTRLSLCVVPIFGQRVSSGDCVSTSPSMKAKSTRTHSRDSIDADDTAEPQVSEQTGANKSADSGALTRGLTVLSAVIAAARPLTLIEIGETVGLSSSTCHRLLQTLIQAGYVFRDASNRYYPTPRAVCPLAIDHPLNLLRRDTADTLKALQHEYGASAGLIVFMGNMRLYVDIVLGRDNVAPYYETQHLTPFHCTVSGKLLLSELSIDERDALLGAAPYASRTPQTIIERAPLMRELDQIARNGISTNFNENILGISAVGGRLGLPGARAIGVIVLTGPSKYFTKNRVAAMRRDLLEATNILSNTSLSVRAVARSLSF